MPSFLPRPWKPLLRSTAQDYDSERNRINAPPLSPHNWQSCQVEALAELSCGQGFHADAAYTGAVVLGSGDAHQHFRLATGASFRGTSTNSRTPPPHGRDIHAISDRPGRAPIFAGRGDAAGCEGKRASAVHHVLPEGDASETRADAQDCSAGRVEPFAQRPELGLCFADAGDWFRFFACRVPGAGGRGVQTGPPATGYSSSTVRRQGAFPVVLGRRLSRIRRIGCNVYETATVFLNFGTQSLHISC